MKVLITLLAFQPLTLSLQYRVMFQGLPVIEKSNGIITQVLAFSINANRLLPINESSVLRTKDYNCLQME